MQVHWSIAVLGSALHVAESLQVAGGLVNSKVADSVRQPAADVADWGTANKVSLSKWWRLLADTACLAETPEKLAAAVIALGNLEPSPSSERQLVERLDRLASAVRESLPRLDAEMPRRVRPLSEQWLARGPGLLRQIERRIGRAAPKSATVYLIYPTSGGFGCRLANQPAVRLEAVVTDTLPQLPEIVRLGWLLGDMAWGPETGEQQQIFTLLAALEGGANVELNALDLTTVETALVGWRLVRPDRAPELAGRLQRWWERFPADADPAEMLPEIPEAG